MSGYYDSSVSSRLLGKGIILKVAPHSPFTYHYIVVGALIHLFAFAGHLEALCSEVSLVVAPCEFCVSRKVCSVLGRNAGQPTWSCRGALDRREFHQCQSYSVFSMLFIATLLIIRKHSKRDSFDVLTK